MTREIFLHTETTILADKEFVLSLQMQARSYTMDIDKVIACVHAFFAYKVAFPKEYEGYKDEHDVRKNLFYYLPSYFQRENNKPQVAPVLPAYKKEVEETKYIPNEAEKKEIEDKWQASMQRQFKAFKNNDAIDIFMPSFQYKAFVERGLLKENDCLFYVEQAERHILERKRIERLTVPSTKRLSLNAMIKRIEHKEYNEQDTSLIMQNAQIECIKTYYRSITELIFKQ